MRDQLLSFDKHLTHNVARSDNEVQDGKVKY